MELVLIKNMQQLKNVSSVCYNTRAQPEQSVSRKKFCDSELPIHPKPFMQYMAWQQAK